MLCTASARADGSGLGRFAVELVPPMSYLFFVEPQGLSPKGLPLVVLVAPRVDAYLSGLAAARTRQKQGRRKLCKRIEDTEGKNLRRVPLGKREDRLEADDSISEPLVAHKTNSPGAIERHSS